ncbi:MAG: hypothetical protein A3D31_06465 [Candidatus Fluviicola riflensis]|nr:MAG: hypothetical protein A3D31_06465 [Candidatus Fluviicola riflensis]OGS89829.1 MAG: hypothetical protein A3E30_02675 [Fluviicola sp. RIFCSPHIGHO2_12_FULL_43_24]
MGLENDVQQDNIGSISAAIFIDDQIVWSRAFGQADNEKAIKADTNTIYRIASITKTITAYLMMLLVQDGTIDLDDPVNKYLPEMATLQHNGFLDNRTITFRHLASHTSGLAVEPGLANAASGPIGEWENKVINSLPTTSVNSVPGERYSYSNIGYAILGLALSRAANKPFMELVEEMIFEPLHMTNSFFVIPEGKENNVASGYRWHAFKGIIDAEKAKIEHMGRGYKVPNGGIYATPNDLARFLMAQCGNSDLLSKEYVEMMQTIQTPESNEYGYGFGYYIRNNDKGIRMIEHDGGVAGYEAMMVFHPKSKIGVIMMRNYDFGLTNILLEPRTILSQLVKSKK